MTTLPRLTLSLLVLVLAASLPARAAEPVTALEVAKRLEMSDKAIEQVKSGEIVAEELEPTSDKDLSIALIAKVDAGLDKIFDAVSSQKLAALSTVTVARGEIDPQNPSLAAMTLDDETVAKLAKDPGDLFYMSEAEAKRVREAGKQGGAQALEAYRKVLVERARAYWTRGLAGIEPYAGDGRSPKVDLGHANDAARKLLTNPELRAGLDVVPAKAAGKAIHRLSWAVQKARDQAAPVLIHNIYYRADDGELFLERRFYSAYDYDSLQILTGVLPIEGGKSSAVFYTNHTYTSQVTGFGGGAKRSIGRKMLRSELVDELTRARKAVSGK